MNILIILIIIEASLILAFIKYKATCYNYDDKKDERRGQDNLFWSEEGCLKRGTG